MGEKQDMVKEKIPGQMNEEDDKPACEIFTDGSYIPEVGAGAAAAMEDGVSKQAYGPIKGISNYEMEIMALIIGLSQFRSIIVDQPEKYKVLAFFSDGQAALELIENRAQPNTSQYLARAVKIMVRQIPLMFRIDLYWTPGQEVFELNEWADKAAKEAAEGSPVAATLPISLGSLLRHVKETFKREACPLKQYKTRGTITAGTLNKTEKRQATTVFQLRCGHCPLKQFLR